MTKDNLVQAVADRDEGQCDQLHSEALKADARRATQEAINALSAAPLASEVSKIVMVIHSALLSAVKREREECEELAKLNWHSMKMLGSTYVDGASAAGDRIAASIRARGEN